MKEHFSESVKKNFPIPDIDYANQDSDIITADTVTLETPVFDDLGPDTAPTPIFVRNIGAESPFDKTDTTPIDTNEIRRQLGLDALKDMSMIDRHDERYALPEITEASSGRADAQRIDRRALEERVARYEHAHEGSHQVEAQSHTPHVAPGIHRMHTDGLQPGRASNNALLKEQVREKNTKKAPFWHTPKR